MLTEMDPRRVAELLVTTAHGERRASGYLVNATTVLIAAHAVDGATSVVVRFDGGTDLERRIESEQIIIADHDFAVVTLPVGCFAENVPPVSFGRLDDRAAVVECCAVGFPRFKLRTIHDASGAVVRRYRDRVQADGRIAVLSNSKEGTLEIITDPPAESPDSDHSPWEGMSGAAVWAGGRIVGVISKHHRTDSPARLAATRIDRWLQTYTTAQVHPIAAALGLPVSADRLPDVIPPSPSMQLTGGYLDQVRDILGTDRLLDREPELDELAEFCAGAAQYAWWQAAPWAGKSALAAWLVLHPPAGVEVASFFITSRWAGHADSDAYTSEVTKQLSRIAGQPEPPVSTAAERNWALRHLLLAATDRVAKRHHRLLLVVDGLDEDHGNTPGAHTTGLPSIASLLPSRPPGALRVLVTSRPHPDLPHDVRPEHPIRRCRPRKLEPSPHAAKLELLAKNELRERRASGDARHIDVLCYLAASGGGLTRTDLSHLTGIPGWELEDLFSGAFGRTLRSHTSYVRDQVFLYAHDTLRAEAEELFQDDLPSYWQRICAWANGYRSRGWPEDTPAYLFAPYARRLFDRDDIETLIEMATDPARHERMFELENSEAFALAEIETSRQAILQRQGNPGLAALAKLAIAHERINDRAANNPPNLSHIWAKLGDPDRAEKIARATIPPNALSRTLAELVAILAATIPDSAEQIAYTIAEPDLRAEALASLAERLATVDSDRAHDLAAAAERAAHAITDKDSRTPILTGLIATLAAADPDRARNLATAAEHTARTITEPKCQAQSLADIAVAVATIDPDRANYLADAAEYAAHAIADTDARTRVLTRLAKALAITDPKRTYNLATAAEHLAYTIYGPANQASALTDLATALATIDPDNAEQIARTIADPGEQASTLAGLSAKLVTIDPGRARNLAAAAEHAAHTITNAAQRQWRLAKLATALATTDPRRAERLARTITDPYRRAQALTEIAAAVATTDPYRTRNLAAAAEDAAHTIDHAYNRTERLIGIAKALATTDPDRAEQIARTITDARQQAGALHGLATALATTDPNRAEQIARTIPSLGQRAWTLASLADKLATTDPAHARSLATAAGHAARGITNPDLHLRLLTCLAGALAIADPDRTRELAAAAEKTASTIADAARRQWRLADLVKALAPADPDHAERIAHTITDPYRRAQALIVLVENFATTDSRHARNVAAAAEHAARNINHPNNNQQLTMADLAKALAKTDPEHAERIARTITEPHDLARALNGLTTALAITHPDRAEQIAYTITEPEQQAHAFASLAKALATTDPNRAHGFASAAEHAIHTITEPDLHPDTLVSLAKALATTHPDQAHSLVTAAEHAIHTITEPDERTWAPINLVRALATTDPDRACDLATAAEHIARTITNPDQQAGALAELAKALANTHPKRAEQIARTIASPGYRSWTLADLAKNLATTDPDRAALVLCQVLSTSEAVNYLGILVALDIEAAQQVADYVLSTDPYQDRRH